MLVHRRRGPLGHRDQVGAVIPDGPVLRRGIVQRVAVDRRVLEPGEICPDRAEVGARTVPGERRALKVTGVPGEQLRVLRDSRPGRDFTGRGRRLAPGLERWPSAGMPGRDRDDHREKDDDRRNGAHRHEGMHQAPMAAVTTPAPAQRPGEWVPMAETPTPATARRPAPLSALPWVIVLQREFLFRRRRGRPRLACPPGGRRGVIPGRPEHQEPHEYQLHQSEPGPEQPGPARWRGVARVAGLAVALPVLVAHDSIEPDFDPYRQGHNKVRTSSSSSGLPGGPLIRGLAEGRCVLSLWGQGAALPPTGGCGRRCDWSGAAHPDGTPPGGRTLKAAGQAPRTIAMTRPRMLAFSSSTVGM